MKKIVAIVVILIAIIVAPYITGKIVENKFKNKVALINSKFEKLLDKKDFIKLDYQAGWFTSTAKTTTDGYTVTHHIVHGPYCTFSLAKIDSKLEISEKKKEQILAFFDNKEPITVTTTLGFAGTTNLNIKSPAIAEKALPNDPKLQVLWQGLEYNADITKDTVTSSLTLPKFSLTEKNKGSFVVSDINAHSTSPRIVDQELNFKLPAKGFKIDSTANIGNISFEVIDNYKPVKFKVTDITSNVNNAGDNYVSNFNVGNVTAQFDLSTFSIDKINFDATANDPLWILRDKLAEANWNSQASGTVNNIKFSHPDSFSRVSLDYYQEQQAIDSDNKITYRELYKASNINVQVPNYNNFINSVDLSYQFGGIPKTQVANMLSTYVEYIKLAFIQGFYQGYNRSIGKPSPEDGYNKMLDFQQQLMLSGATFGTVYLQGTPDVIANLKLAGNKGAANIDFKAALVKPAPNVANSKTLMMQAPERLNAKISFSVATSLVDELLKLADLDEDKQAVLKTEAMQRYPIIMKEGQYMLDVEFKDNSFYVNGKLDPDFVQKYSQELRSF